MWLFTKYGFYSVVRHPNGKLQVRSRSRGDLWKLAPLFKQRPKMLVLPAADYPFRFIVEEGEWAPVAAKLTTECIDYENFKHEVGRHDVPRAHTYSDVWAVLERAYRDERPNTNHAKGTRP